MRYVFILLIFISGACFSQMNNRYDESYNPIDTTIDTTNYSYSYKNYPTKFKNFNGNISFSVGIKSVDLNVSRIRIDYEYPTKYDLISFGGTLHMYVLQDFYNGVKVESYVRLYHPEDGNGYGAFIQLRGGYGTFKYDKINSSFNTFGGGADLGYKFLLGHDHNDYKGWFSLTGIAGLQIYTTPTYSHDFIKQPLSTIFQLRFGYQF